MGQYFFVKFKCKGQYKESHFQVKIVLKNFWNGLFWMKDIILKGSDICIKETAWKMTEGYKIF